MSSSIFTQIIEDTENEIQQLQDRYNVHLKNYSDDIKIYMIALNLSGEREQLEDMAYKLIEKHGLLKALKISREAKSVSM